MGYSTATIGCGRMARGHAHTFFEVDLPLVAGVEISEQSLAKWRTDFGAGQKVYTDMHLMLAEAKPDLVAVVTPEQAHCEAVVAAAEVGAEGIICENPPCMNLAETERMIDVCKKTGTMLAVDHQ